MRSYDIGKPYTVIAHHANHQSHNRMHTDGLPQRLGFRGAFVLGVANYGNMTRALVATFGETWLGRALIEALGAAVRSEHPIVRIEALGHLEGIIGVTAEREHTEPRAGDVRLSQADNRLMTETMDFHCEVPFDEGLRRTVEWFAAR